MCGGPGHCSFQAWLSISADLRVLLRFICYPCQETWPLRTSPPVLGSSHAGQLVHVVVGTWALPVPSVAVLFCRSQGAATVHLLPMSGP